jgi:hypothetical protein
MPAHTRYAIHRFDFSAMGCPCALQLEADAEVAARATAAAQAEVDRLDRKYSHYRDDSLVAQIGASADAGESIVVDNETADLLDFSATLHAQSGGRFDITAGALTKLWDLQGPRAGRPDRTSARTLRLGSRGMETSAPAGSAFTACAWISAASSRNTLPTARRRSARRRHRPWHRRSRRRPDRRRRARGPLALAGPASRRRATRAAFAQIELPAADLRRARLRARRHRRRPALFAHRRPGVVIRSKVLPASAWSPTAASSLERHPRSACCSVCRKAMIGG